MIRRLFLLVLAGALLALTPVAQASPPDQTWIAGLYDDADFDNAVIAVTAIVASLELQPLPDPECIGTVVAFVPQIDESLRATLTLSSNRTRPPPIS